ELQQHVEARFALRGESPEGRARSLQLKREATDCPALVALCLADRLLSGDEKSLEGGQVDSFKFLRHRSDSAGFPPQVTPDQTVKDAQVIQRDSMSQMRVLEPSLLAQCCNNPGHCQQCHWHKCI